MYDPISMVRKAPVQNVPGMEYWANEGLTWFLRPMETASLPQHSKKYLLHKCSLTSHQKVRNKKGASAYVTVVLLKYKSRSRDILWNIFIQMNTHARTYLPNAHWSVVSFTAAPLPLNRCWENLACPVTSQTMLRIWRVCDITGGFHQLAW